MHYNIDFNRRRELQHLANSLEFSAPTYESGGGWPSLDPDWSSMTAAVTYSPIDLSTLTDAELAWLADHVDCTDGGFPSLRLRDDTWIFYSLSV